MQTYIAFSYSSGSHGFVLVEALKTFQKKDAAVQTALSIQTATDNVDRSAELNKAMGIIISANRKTKRNGWYFHNRADVDRQVAEGRATIVGA